MDRNKNIKSSDVLIFFKNNDNLIFDVFKPLEIKINLSKSTEDVKLSENGKIFIITSGSGSLDGGDYNYKNDEFEGSNNIKPIIIVIGNGKSFGNIFIYI